MGGIALPGWLRELRLGGDVALALGVALLLAVLVVPLPVLLLDAGLAVSITVSVLVLMVALFLQRPLDFTAFPQMLLLTTLLRLALNGRPLGALLLVVASAPLLLEMARRQRAPLGSNAT